METNEENILTININQMKNRLKFKILPKEEEWRVNLIKELTNVKQNKLEVRFDNNMYISEADIEDLIFYAATS